MEPLITSFYKMKLIFAALCLCIFCCEMIDSFCTLQTQKQKHRMKQKSLEGNFEYT